MPEAAEGPVAAADVNRAVRAHGRRREGYEESASGYVPREYDAAVRPQGVEDIVGRPRIDGAVRSLGRRSVEFAVNGKLPYRPGGFLYLIAASAGILIIAAEAWISPAKQVHTLAGRIARDTGKETEDKK